MVLAMAGHGRCSTRYPPLPSGTAFPWSSSTSALMDGNGKVAEPGPVRVVGRALVHDARRAIGERSVDDVGMAGHPADVSGAPEDVFFFQIEHVLVRRRGPDQVATRGVQHAFRLASRPGRVQD